MKAKLIRHDKITDEYGNTVEIRMWSVPKTADKPYGFKYSLVYIVNGERAVGYDNAEQKGDHRHYREREEPYLFASLEKLAEDFYRDVKQIKKDMYENQKSQSRDKRP
ncbi:MAG: hypothetical protein GY795_15010 [Desulfobacterales bacterium]|nr:hypothetical protein [Desulfobacterales bacterium]